jgi:hypothetical protein
VVAFHSSGFPFRQQFAVGRSDRFGRFSSENRQNSSCSLGGALTSKVFDQNIVPDANIRAIVERAKLMAVAPLIHAFFGELLAEYFAYPGSDFLGAAMYFDLGDV